MSERLDLTALFRGEYDDMTGGEMRHRYEDPRTAEITVTDCEHRLVDASVFTEGKLAGQVALWSCRFCSVRFYPACPVCVDVGHRNVVHPQEATDDR